jgi:hypothetical protein
MLAFKKRRYGMRFVSFEIWKQSINFHLSNLNRLLSIFPLLCLSIVGDALHSLLIKQKYQHETISPFQAVREVWKLIPSLFIMKLYFEVSAFLWSFVPIYGIIKGFKHRQYWAMASNVLVFEGLSGNDGRKRCQELIENTGMGVRTLVTMPSLVFVAFLLLWVLIATFIEETTKSYSLFIFIIVTFWLAIPMSGAVNSFLYLKIIKSKTKKARGVSP